MAKEQVALDPSHCKTLDECLASCGVTQKWIEAGERAGLDMASAKEQNQAQADVARGLKKEFFPQQP